MKEDFLTYHTHRITIETAKNGYLVYINEDCRSGTIRDLPYVFESYESMQTFLKEKLKN